ncbi:ferritin-like domain-containing protein [Sciscionella sediminilitoris]|uniref:ferritin-like domain-containing protein n=1 Tax=Sciscionella sediminilitoris TaxID=1445613 RepID=UPI0004DF69AE|nr:ferritin-like domain-containing protein [Sciscionella sp. SE31]
MSTPSEDEIDALQQALAAEHAAVWSYGLASAFVAAGEQQTVTKAAATHRAERDSAERLIRDGGGQPVAQQPGYATPKPVTDADSAMRLLAVAERDCAATWRAVLERTEDVPLRETALHALTYSAVAATRWRKLTGQVPSAAALPGT